MEDNFICAGKVLELIKSKLESGGFKAFEEFYAVDSMIYGDFCAGYYSMRDCRLIASSIHHDNLCKAVEVEYVFDVKLMGKRCDYSDHGEFVSRCDNFYAALLRSRIFIFRGAELGKVFRNVQMGRLERDMTLTVRMCMKEESYGES